MVRSLCYSVVMLAVVTLAAVENTAQAHKPASDWVRITDTTGWQPRDSQAEVVYDGRMWILGGWLNSFEAPP